jgi:hypothetical protein
MRSRAMFIFSNTFVTEKMNMGNSRCEHSYFFHLFSAAAFAISARRSGVIFSARALPPRLPMETAAGSLPSFSGVGKSSSISPVAIFATLIARR